MIGKILDHDTFFFKTRTSSSSSQYEKKKRIMYSKNKLLFKAIIQIGTEDYVPN